MARVSTPRAADARTTLRKQQCALIWAAPDVWVWRIWLDVPPPLVSRFGRLLAPAERARAAELRLSRTRQRWMVCRGWTRRLLGQTLHEDARTVQLARSAAGKPLVVRPGGAPPVGLSISYAGPLALVAISLRGSVGVDLERIRRAAVWQAAATRLLAPDERAALAALPGAARPEAFARCWVMKEAYLKARGSGLRYGLASWCVPVGAARATVLEVDTTSWQCYPFAPIEGWVAALVLPHPARRDAEVCPSSAVSYLPSIS